VLCNTAIVRWRLSRRRRIALPVAEADQVTHRAVHRSEPSLDGRNADFESLLEQAGAKSGWQSRDSGYTFLPLPVNSLKKLSTSVAGLPLRLCQSRKLLQTKA
jgi:hypothetical protein